MEMKVNEVIIPEQITWNYDEIKAELTQKIQKYETLAYTEDQIQEAKKDRAALNKLKTALNDERLRREREYMKPFEEFKAQVNEIRGIIDKPIKIIDEQLEGYEEDRKRKKREEIGAYWAQESKHPDWITLPLIFQDKWLNASYSMTQIKKDIDSKVGQINYDMEILEMLPEYSFEAVEVYKTTLDMNKAIAEGQRLADIQKRKEENERQKAEAERLKAEQEAELMAKVEEEEAEAIMADMEAESSPAPEQKEEKKMMVRFEVELTVDQAKELRAFFQERGIRFWAMQ
jgi:hypothetical protein